MPLPPRVLVILAFVLAPIALPAADAQEVPPTLRAEWAAPGLLRVELTRGTDFSGRVLVTHDDPLAGTVVDRLVSVSFAAGEVVSFDVAGLPPATGVRVRVLAPTDGPDRLPYVALYDGRSVARITALAETMLVATPAMESAAFPAHLVAELGRNDGIVDHRLLVTRDGVVALGYAHRPGGSLSVRLSRDGGHTWTGEIRVATEPAGREYAWDMEELATGEIGLVYRSSAFPVPAWEHARLGPLNGTLRHLATTPPTGLTTQHAAADPALLPDGSALWAEVVSGEGAARTFRLIPGSAPVATGTVPWPVHFQHLVLAGDATRALVVFVASDRLHVARSNDSAATFGPAAEMRSLTRIQANATLSVREARIGADGVAHVLTTLTTPQSPSSVTFDEAYTRLEPAGAEAARVTSTRGTGQMTVSGARVAIIGWRGFGEEVLIESLDGGRTFSGPLRFRTEPIGNRSIVMTTGLAHLPDGRLVISGRTLSYAPESSDGVAVALPFDPEPTEAPVFTVAREPPPTPPAPTTATPPIVVTTPMPEPPTVATPTLPLEAVADVESVVLALTPEVVRLAPGGVATVRALVTNLGNGDRGAELPTVAGLPPGITARVTFDGELIVADGVPASWTRLPAGETRTFDIVLTAAVDAPDASAVAVVSARHATDRPSLSAALGVEVAPATDLAAEGASGLLQGAPAAAVVLAGVGAAAGAIVLAARTDVGKIVAGAATLPLYSRIKRADVLRHEVRAGVYEQIRSSPGSRFEELRQTLALPAGVLTFHLGVLEREGYVRTSRDWTRRRYYVQGAPLPVAASSTEQTLETLLSREPGMSAGEVATRLGISRQLARYHLKRLERQGWVQAEAEGSSIGYRLVRR